ncbi:MAG: hypothetical protein RR330_05605 [Alistipes sp.]
MKTENKLQATRAKGAVYQMPLIESQEFYVEQGFQGSTVPAQATEAMPEEQAPSNSWQ